MLSQEQSQQRDEKVPYFYTHHKKNKMNKKTLSLTEIFLMPFIVSRHTQFESRASRRLGGRSLNTGTLHNNALDAVMPLLDEFSSCLESDTTSTYIEIGHSPSRLAVAFFPTTKVHGASETARSFYFFFLYGVILLAFKTLPKGAWNCHNNQKLLLYSCQIKVKIVASWSVFGSTIVILAAPLFCAPMQ